MIAGENNTRNSRIALSQSKSHCREAEGARSRNLEQEALSEKIARWMVRSRKQKPWMVLAGGLKHLHSENRRIERVIRGRVREYRTGKDRQ